MPKENSVIPKRIPGSQYFDKKVEMMEEQDEQQILDNTGLLVSIS